MRVYISGPISGRVGGNAEAFAYAARTLEAAGYEAVNPLQIGVNALDPINPAPEEYRQCLREDLRALLDCDGVAILPEWWLSVGARNEVQVAGILGLAVRSVDEWIWSVLRPPRSVPPSRVPGMPRRVSPGASGPAESRLD